MPSSYMYNVYSEGIQSSADLTRDQFHEKDVLRHIYGKNSGIHFADPIGT